MQIIDGEFERLDKKPKKRKLLKKLVLGLIILFLLPFILVPFYSFIPPISLPVIEKAVTLQNVSWRWRSIDKISPNLQQAVIAAEDGKFCTHNGVDWQAINKALKKAERRNKFTHGGSTITMQTAKNLFLWYLPRWLRKPIEIPLAMWINTSWSKRRTMEVYLNIAEFGKGVYGAEAAAQKYFGKPAKNLTKREAALMAAVLPSPKKRKLNKPNKYVHGYAERIKSRSHQQQTDCLK